MGNIDRTVDDLGYEWWDIGESSIGRDVYNVLAPIQLGDKDYTDWDIFASDHPAGAYAWKVGGRHGALADSVVALRLVQKLLSVEEPLPLPTALGAINRHEWIRLVVDTMLFRFTSIRDQAFHLVKEILRLDIRDQDLRITRLEREAGSEEAFFEPLRRVARAGKRLRHERNRRAHQGLQRWMPDEMLFKALAYGETPGSEPTGGRADGREFNLKAAFTDVLTDLSEEFLPACRSLIGDLDEFLEALHPHFDEQLTKLKEAQGTGADCSAVN